MPVLISQLAQGRDRLTCVSRGTSLRDALRMMIELDFSQLPVVDESDHLIGIVSEQSIARMQYQTGGDLNILDALTVEQCQDEAVILPPERDLFEALRLLETVSAVVVVDEGKPTGIVTTYDTTQSFRNLAEGLMWAQDIELTLREYIERAFADPASRQAALMRAFGPHRKAPEKPAKEYKRLTLGDHIQLIIADGNWDRFARVFQSKEVFSNLMGRARDVRNEIAHIRAQAGKSELDALKRAYRWLSNCPKLPATQPVNLHIVNLEALPATGGGHAAQASLDIQYSTQGRGKYAPLGAWLQSIDPSESKARVNFQDIERLLGDALPPSALDHRSWWANDSVGHRQSIMWLQAGWKVESVDFVAQEVTFARLSRARPGEEAAS